VGGVLRERALGQERKCTIMDGMVGSVRTGEQGGLSSSDSYKWSP